MELSEAIKAGAQLRPQAFGGYLRTTQTKEGIRAAGTCALGAAMEAEGCMEVAMHSGVAVPSFVAEKFPLSETWPLLAEQADYPCGCLAKPLRANAQIVIPHLNDDHRWSREKIASWVRHLEKK